MNKLEIQTKIKRIKIEFENEIKSLYNEIKYLFESMDDYKKKIHKIIVLEVDIDQIEKDIDYIKDSIEDNKQFEKEAEEEFNKENIKDLENKNRELDDLYRQLERLADKYY